MAIDKAKRDELRALAEKATPRGVGVEPIPNGNGAVRCRRCGAVLMPGTEAYDWHGASAAYACEPSVPGEFLGAVPALLDEVERLERERVALARRGADAERARVQKYLAAMCPEALGALDRLPVFEATEPWVRAVLGEPSKPALDSAAALSLLREIEWSGPRSERGAKTCPACGREAQRIPYTEGIVGHVPDCRLAALLRGAP